MLGPGIKADGFVDLSHCRFAKKTKAHFQAYSSLRQIHTECSNGRALFSIKLICFVQNDKTKDSTICVLFTHAGKVSNFNRLGGICNCCGR